MWKPKHSSCFRLTLVSLTSTHVHNVVKPQQSLSVLRKERPHIVHRFTKISCIWNPKCHIRSLAESLSKFVATNWINTWETFRSDIQTAEYHHPETSVRHHQAGCFLQSAIQAWFCWWTSDTHIKTHENTLSQQTDGTLWRRLEHACCLLFLSQLCVLVVYLQHITPPYV